MNRKIIKIIKGSLVVVVAFIIILSVFSLTIVNTDFFRKYIEDETFLATSIPIKIRGSIEFSLIGMRPAVAIYDVLLDDKFVLYKLEVSPVFSNDEVKGAPFKVFMTAEGLRTRNINFGNYNSAIYVYKTGISMPSIKGDVGSAKLDGKLEYINDKLKLKLNLDNVPYSQISKDMNGKFRAKIDVVGKGAYIEKVGKTLEGSVLFIGGRGTTRSRSVNLWTTDFLKTMFSGKKDLMKFECIVADFSLDKGKAYTNSLFLDSKETSIIGEGNINLYDRTLDMKLTPKPKGNNFIDIIPAVRVNGFLSNPKIAVDVMDVAKNIGKAVFTAMNPAALLLPAIKNLSKDEDLCEGYLKQRKIK